MTQRDRDQLVTLHKAQKKLITQREAAKELDVTARHLRRFVEAPESGKAIERSSTDCAAKLPIDGLAVDKRDLIFQILSEDVYRGFGPTLASEYLRDKDDIQIGREALPKLMSEVGLWHPRRMKIKRTCGGSTGCALASWFNGTCQITTGWKGAVRGCN